MSLISLTRISVVQRLLSFTTGSFLEVQFLRFSDTSAVIHDGPHRASTEYSFLLR
jgi:hypothetical protein